jgi:hypothetical protein
MAKGGHGPQNRNFPLQNCSFYQRLTNRSILLRLRTGLSHSLFLQETHQVVWWIMDPKHSAEVSKYSLNTIL